MDTIAVTKWALEWLLAIVTVGFMAYALFLGIIALATFAAGY
jgi:hypothetical protein